jgi:hypothetical protein
MAAAGEGTAYARWAEAARSERSGDGAKGAGWVFERSAARPGAAEGAGCAGGLAGAGAAVIST